MSKLQMRIVSGDEAGIRLDRWFKRHYADITHGQLQKLLRTGQVRVAGKRAEAATRIEAGQEIRVPPPALAKATARQAIGRHTGDIKKLILFEDDDVLVLNKPAGLAVQGGTGIRDSVDDMLAALANDKTGKPKLVHRLDRDTSGVLLVAKNIFAAGKLTASFRHRDARKMYWAVTLGAPQPDQGRIEAALIKHGEMMYIANDKDENSKSAATLYQTIDRAAGQGAFVALWPITGRTHQLRVHMAHIGAPIMGDKLYGKTLPEGLPAAELGKGLQLHARRLIIRHPRHGVIDVTAPLGADMRKTWKYFAFDADVEVEFGLVSCL